MLTDTNVPMVGIMDTDEHLRRRKAWQRGMSPAARRAQLITGLLRPAIFFLSIPIALAIGGGIAQLFWLTLLLLGTVGRGVERRADAQVSAS